MFAQFRGIYLLVTLNSALRFMYTECSMFEYLMWCEGI